MRDETVFFISASIEFNLIHVNFKISHLSDLTPTCHCLTLPVLISIYLHVLQSLTNFPPQPPPAFLIPGQHSSSRLWWEVWAKMSQGLRGCCLLHPAGSVLTASCAWASSYPNRCGVAFLSAPLCPIEFHSGPITFLHVYRWVRRKTWAKVKIKDKRNDGKGGV